MKTSKLIIISILFLILCGSSVLANDELGRGPDGDSPIDDLIDVEISAKLNPSPPAPDPGEDPAI